MRRLLLALACLPALGLAQVPTPESVIGHPVGADTKLASWKTILGYMRQLDRASDRVAIREIGKTTEGRDMVVVEISSAANIRRRDQLLSLSAKVHDPRKIKAAKEEARILKEAKTTILLNCSIHASEVAAAQMSMELAYSLAVGNDDDTKQILDNCYVELVACANPDGLDMVKDWYDRNLGTKYEDAPMPWLYQKYVGHDNNRDWWLISQAETINVSKYLYNVGYPTLLYDIHQMGGNGARFFVPPFFDPTNPNIDPVVSQSIMLLGAHMATDLAAGDRKGVLWSAIYDNWWQGGMRTTPQRHNVVAILTEAASAKIASPVTIRPEDLRGHDRGLPVYEPRVNFPDPWPGGVWRLRDIVDYELIACRSVLRVGARYRDMWLRNQLEMAKKQVRLGAEESPRSWIIPADQPNREGVEQLLRSLMLAGVEVHRATEDFGVGELIFKKGDYVIRADQPYRAHVKDLMEIQRYPERREYPGGPVDRPYDVAGWTAPMLMGIDWLQVGAKFKANLERLTEIPEAKKANPLGDAKPRVGLYQPWTASMDEGWTRFVWEEYGVPYKTLHNEDIRKSGLNERFDAIFLPGVSAQSILLGVSAQRMPEPYAGGIGDEGVEQLQRFVEDGGTLVLMDESCGLASKLGLPVKNALDGLGRDKFYCPGSILLVELDQTHPLTAGMYEASMAYFENSQAFDVSPDAKNVKVVAKYRSSEKLSMLLSGFVLGEQYLRGKPCILDWTVGKGHILMFGFPVQHRGQTLATFPFMWNAMKMSVSKEKNKS